MTVGPELRGQHLVVKAELIKRKLMLSHLRFWPFVLARKFSFLTEIWKDSSTFSKASQIVVDLIFIVAFIIHAKWHFGEVNFHNVASFVADRFDVNWCNSSRRWCFAFSRALKYAKRNLFHDKAYGSWLSFLLLTLVNPEDNRVQSNELFRRKGNSIFHSMNFKKKNFLPDYSPSWD